MAEQLQYKCPCCGGSIEFDADSQNLKCPYCDTEFAPETLLAYDEQLQTSAEDPLAEQAPEQTDWNDGEQWTEEEADGMRVYNPTLTEVWFNADGTDYSVKPGEMITMG